MQKKISKKTVLLVTLAWFNVVEVSLVCFMQKNLIHNSPIYLMGNVSSFNATTQRSSGFPIRLKIPAINVDAKIIPVGLTSEGEMGVPKGPSEVAWFDLGKRPGESGSAVIAGHFGWKNKIPAVFDNLHKLNTGDKISVQDESGAMITFRVSKIRKYKKDDAPTDVFGSSDDGSHLNLVTCTGSWNPKEKTRAGRLVVYADRDQAERI